MGKRSQSKEGAVEKCKLAEVCVYDSADVLDQEDSEWTKGWETRYRRVKTVKMHENVVFNVDQEVKYSPSVRAEAYSRIIIYVKPTGSGNLTGTAAYVWLQASDNDADWYDWESGGYDLTVSSTLKSKFNGYPRDDVGPPYIRLAAKGASVSAANYYTLNTKVTLIT